MKKIFTGLFLLVFCTFSYGAVCGFDDDCEMIPVSFDTSSFQARKQAKEQKTKEIQEFVEKYKKAPSKEKPAVKKELNAYFTKQEKERVAQEKILIERQKQKLEAWAESLKKQEENLPAIAAQKTQDAIDGKIEKSSFEKLKEKKDSKSGKLQKKAMDKANNTLKK